MSTLKHRQDDVSGSLRFWSAVRFDRPNAVIASAHKAIQGPPGGGAMDRFVATLLAMTIPAHCGRL
jgi:hypothetical protein